MLNKQLPTFDVTVAFMLFLIIVYMNAFKLDSFNTSGLLYMLLILSESEQD